MGAFPWLEGSLASLPLMDSSLHSRYQDQGYVLIKAAIPSALMDTCLQALNAVKRRNRTFLYYTQSTHRWTFPQLSEGGFLKESILNPTQQVQAPKFAAAVRNILYHDQIHQALCAIYPGSLDFVSWQDMAFDRSTATIDHLDSWYLDTEIPGGVCGLWVALEDIVMESGPFFVCPGSHRLGPISKQEAPDHATFLRLIQHRIEEFHLERKPMLLCRGDILLWHSFLIHGAFHCRNEAVSRKSLTAHFYRFGQRRQDALSPRHFRGDLRRMGTTVHPRLHRLRKPGRSPAFYALGGPLLALKDQAGMISSRAWNMRREP